MSDLSSLFSQRPPWLSCGRCDSGSPVTVSASKIPILSCHLFVYMCLYMCLFVRLSVYPVQTSVVLLSRNACPLVCVVGRNAIFWVAFTCVQSRGCPHANHTYSPALTRKQANRGMKITHTLCTSTEPSPMTSTSGLSQHLRNPISFTRHPPPSESHTNVTS